MFTTYILYSSRCDRFYIGFSSNPIRRLQFHNSSPKGYTLRCRPWVIAWSKTFKTKTEAVSLEKKIKSWKSTDMIRLLIKNEI